MNTNDIKIETMRQEHIDGLVAIEKASFSKPWTKQGFESELANDTANFLVAVYDNREIGYIGFHVVLDEGDVANIAVLPEYRRCGVGKILLENAVRVCKEKKLAFLSLEVRKSNENAIALYKKFDFEIVGERKNFYTAPKEDASIMTLNFTSD